MNQIAAAEHEDPPLVVLLSDPLTSCAFAHDGRSDQGEPV
jgi:hypothetical protein